MIASFSCFSMPSLYALRASTWPWRSVITVPASVAWALKVSLSVVKVEIASSFSTIFCSNSIFSFSNNTKYTPKNYNDKYANGPLSMGAAISYSDNVFAVKTHLFFGENNLVSVVLVSENGEIFDIETIFRW